MNALTERLPGGWRRAAAIVGLAACIGLALVPIINIVTIVATTGANNPSVDFVAAGGPFIDKVLSGGYDWRNLLKNSFDYSHAYTLPYLVELAVARFFHGDFNLLLYIAIAAAALRVILLHGALGRHLPPGPLRWLLWPVVAGLVFSTSQINNFTWSFSALPYQFGLLGLAFGLWGLVQFPNRVPGVLCMAAGGLAATWSRAEGLPMWPVFLLGLWLLNYRRIWHYAVWLLMMAVAAFPYVRYGLMNRNWPDAHLQGSLVHDSLLLDVIGRPFANDVGRVFTRLPGAEWAAAVGLALIVAALPLAWRWRRRPARPARFAPGLLLLCYGLLTSAEQVLPRNSVNPIYISAGMCFWIGLAGLAFAAWAEAADSERALPSGRVASASARVWSVAVIAVMIGLYLHTNLTYTDKVLYMTSRSPASASCLRHYRTAPTYCEERVFLWPLGNPDLLKNLAWPLEKHRLSVFAPHQEWTLQGDFGLEVVREQPAPGQPPAAWYTDLAGEKAPWLDYRHLSLLLTTPGTISWTLDLPQNTQRAELRSAVGLSPLAPWPPGSAVTCEVYAELQGEARQPVYRQTLAPTPRGWQPFSVPLTQFAGRTLTLHLTSTGDAAANGAWLMYRYPVIDIDLGEEAAPPPAPAVIPANTELSPASPRATPGDLQFDGADPKLWQVADLQPVAGQPGSWVAGTHPSLTPSAPIGVCLGDYTHLSASLAASPAISPRAFRIFYNLRSDTAAGKDQLGVFTVPLLADGALHTYFYNLRLLAAGAKAGARLSILRFDPINSGNPGDKSLVRFAELRLIRNGDGGPSRCAGAPPEVPPETIVGELTRDAPVSQTFAPHCDGLNQIELMAATFIRVNTHPVIVRVTDEATGRTVGERVFAGPSIPDNAWISAPFPPVSDSRSRVFRITALSPDSVPGDAITLYRSKSDVYPGGEAFAGDRSLGADLTFRYGCAE